MKNAFLIALAVLALVPGAAGAATIEYTPCAVGDVTFDPNLGFAPPSHAADACAGWFAGNPNDGTDLSAYLDPTIFGSWTSAPSFKAEADNTVPWEATLSYLDHTWTLRATPSVSGSWTLDVDPATGLPILGVDFLVLLKSTTAFAVYLFEDEAVYGQNGGMFNVTLLKNGNHPELSHMEVYLRGGETTVPEPASMFLLGTGLLGLAGMVRRRMR